MTKNYSVLPQMTIYTIIHLFESFDQIYLVKPEHFFAYLIVNLLDVSSYYNKSHYNNIWHCSF